MKKLLVFCVAIMCVLVLLMTLSFEALGVIGEDGLAMPADSHVLQSLRTGDGEWQPLVAVGSEDEIYATPISYFVGKERTAMDKDFPIFIRSGAALRFLNEENWLISADVSLLQSYAGLYLSEGYTYDEDMRQADIEEFILLQLPNGLHMNAQKAVLTTRLKQIDIPANSVLRFAEDSLRWYWLDGDALLYKQETALFDATFTIGEHTYSYSDLLKALGLLSEAIDKLEKGQDPEPQLGMAEDLLTEDEEDKKDNSGKHGSGQTGAGTVDGKAPAAGGAGSNGAGGAGGGNGSAGQGGGTGSGGNPSGGAGAGGDGSQPGTGTGGGSGDAPGTDSTPGDGSASGDGNVPGGTSPDGSKPGDGSDGDTGTGKPGTGAGDSGTTGGGTSDGKPDDSGEGEGSSGGDGGDGSSGAGGAEGDVPGDGTDETLPDETTPDETTPDETTPDETTPDETEPGQDGGDPEGSEPTLPGETTPGGGNDNENEGADGDGTGSEGDDPEGSDPDDTPPEGTEPEGDQTGSDNPRKPIYKEPKISFVELDPWCYAVKGKLVVDDPASTLYRGVRVTVYRDLRTKTIIPSSYENEEGWTVYPAEDYEGRSAMMRKTLQGTQEVALSTISPDTKVYIQLNYRYNAQVKSTVTDENGVQTEVTNVVRKTVYSDLIEVSTTSNAGITPVWADWEETFAYADTQFRMEDMVLRNVSDYNPNLETFDFENFKKNILPYVNRLEFTLRDENGETVVLSANSAVVSNAQNLEGALFTSPRGELKQNTKYTYTVAAKDRYGNNIPLVLGTGCSGVLYTSKTAPKVIIEEVENVTDKLTLKVRVNDPANALLTDKPLQLQMLNSTTGVPAVLYGSWSDGERFGSTDMLDNTTVLTLENPAHDKSYTFTLESLAFSQSYLAQVLGGYDLQPSVAEPEAGMLQPVESAVLGTLRCYTASISSGSIQFATRIDNLKDTSVTLNLTMTRNSTVAILPMVDAFRLHVKDPGNAVVKTVELTMDALNTYDYTYLAETQSVVVDPGNATTPRVELVGLEEQFTGKTLWEALLISITETGEDGSAVYSSPVQLRISLPEDTLKTSTRYHYSVDSMVIKTGKEYFIPTMLTSSEFTTKKIQPELQFTDFFVAANVAEFIDTRVYDPDGTIQEGGLVNVRLYQGNILLDVKQIYATRDADGPTTNIRFENIIAGAKYRVEFRLAAYNDAEGYASYVTDVLLDAKEFAFEFEGGSGLHGSLQLKSLDYSSVADKAKEFFYFSADDVAEMLENKTWKITAASGSNPVRYTTHRMELPADATYIRLTGRMATSSTYAYFNDSAGKSVTVGNKVQATSMYAEPLFKIPEGAKTVYFILYAPDDVDAMGLTAHYYTTGSENLVGDATVDDLELNKYKSADNWVTSNNHHTLNVPIYVNPGDLLWMPTACHYVSMYNSLGKYVGIALDNYCAAFVVPENVSCIYVTFSNGSKPVTQENLVIHKVAAADQSEGFAARVQVNVEDTKGYLATEVEEPKVTLTLSRSETTNEAVYSQVSSQEVALSQVSDDRWIADQVETLTALAPGCGWRMVMTTQYRGAEVKLDEIYFQTDSFYQTISNEAEFFQMIRNPHGRYLVVKDFTITSTQSIAYFYGSLDGQGHTITIAKSNNHMLFSTLYPGGFYPECGV